MTFGEHEACPRTGLLSFNELNRFLACYNMLASIVPTSRLVRAPRQDCVPLPLAAREANASEGEEGKRGDPRIARSLSASITARSKQSGRSALTMMTSTTLPKSPQWAIRRVTRTTPQSSCFRASCRGQVSGHYSPMARAVDAPATAASYNQRPLVCGRLDLQRRCKSQSDGSQRATESVVTVAAAEGEMPHSNWRDITSALIALPTALLLSSAPAVALAQPAVDGAIHARTYAVVSMVSTRLSFVTRKFSTGSRLEQYDRRSEALPDDVIATAVLQTMANSIHEIAPAARTELLEIKLPAAQANERLASDDVLAVARQALRNLAEGRSWDFIMLIGPRLEVAGRHLLGPNLQGLGFYVDPGKGGVYRPQAGAGDIVKGDRFMSPFVSSEVWLLDAKTLGIVATHSNYGYCRYISAKGDSLDPWQFFDSAKMLRFLALVIQHDVGESTKVVMRKGLGMPEVPAREHVEFCTHRYN